MLYETRIEGYLNPLIEEDVMRLTPTKLQIGILILSLMGTVSTAFAQATKLDDPATIKIMPRFKTDIITPKRSARVSDFDGIRQSAVRAVVSPFSVSTKVGGDKVEVSVPEFQLDEVQWVADPIGCVDDDPKTKCHPTWGNEYYGQVGGDLTVYVEYADGGVLYFDYGIVDLVLNVTVIDNKVRKIDGYLQITYSIATELENYRVPIVGKLTNLK